ncbi:MAG: VOC family protein [Pseudomonadales bacterium]
MATRTTVDHLMWGAADLAEGVAEIGRLFDAEPVPGGAHPGRGTRNALLGLADGRYLEIIAPDPDQPQGGDFAAALADLAQPALITWALRSDDLPGIARQLAAAGVDTRGPVATRRTTPDGTELAWELLFPRGHEFGALMPFFIDWGDCVHPADGLRAAGTLEAITVESPHAAVLRRLLGNVDVPLVVREADEPALHATIVTAHGDVVLEASPTTVGLRFG